LDLNNDAMNTLSPQGPLIKSENKRGRRLTQLELNRTSQPAPSTPLLETLRLRTSYSLDRAEMIQRTRDEISESSNVASSEEDTAAEGDREEDREGAAPATTNDQPPDPIALITEALRAAQQERQDEQQKENDRVLLDEIELAGEEVGDDALGNITNLRDQWEEFPDIPPAAIQAIRFGTLPIGMQFVHPKSLPILSLPSRKPSARSRPTRTRNR
jgi:hypothetical protein